MIGRDKHMERHTVFMDGRINVVKITVLPKTIYSFKANLFKRGNSQEKKILNFACNHIGLQIGKILNNILTNISKWIKY